MNNNDIISARESMAETDTAGDNQAAIILHNFNNQELAGIVNLVKREHRGKDIVFAKSTPTSLEMKLGDLIVDICEDHNYLKENPPARHTPSGGAKAPPAGDRG